MIAWKRSQVRPRDDARLKDLEVFAHEDVVDEPTISRPTEAVERTRSSANEIWLRRERRS